MKNTDKELEDLKREIFGEEFQENLKQLSGDQRETIKQQLEELVERYYKAVLEPFNKENG